MLKRSMWMAAAMTAALSGCVLAPGPALDSSRMHDDLSKPTDTTTYDVNLITPELVFKLKESDAADARAREASLHAMPADEVSDYRVGVNDVLGITVWGHPELTQGGNAATAPLPDTGTLQGMGSLGPASSRRKAHSVPMVRASLTRRASGSPPMARSSFRRWVACGSWGRARCRSRGCCITA